jgi:hypothetical protein
VYLDGSGDYLTSSSNPAYAFGTGDFTIEGWFYFTGTISTYQRPWWFGDDNDNLEISSSVLRVSGASQGTLITSATTIQPNMWYHIAVTRASGNYKLWLNGTQQGSTATNSYNSSTRTFTLGATSSAANPITGYISGLRISKGESIYSANFLPSAAPPAPTANTVLLTNMTNAAIYDTSMTTTFETVYDARISTVVKKFGSASMYFDGTGDHLYPQSTTVTQNLGAADWTAECWFYTTNAAASDQGLIYINGDGGSTFYAQLRLGLSSSGVYLLCSTNGGSWTVQTNVVGSISSNQWYHVAATRSGTSVKLFLNGTQIGTTQTVSGSLMSPGAYTTIAAYPGAVSPFIGYLDDLRITKGVARYTANFTPPSIESNDYDVLTTITPTLINY